MGNNGKSNKAIKKEIHTYKKTLKVVIERSERVYNDPKSFEIYKSANQYGRIDEQTLKHIQHSFILSLKYIQEILTSLGGQDILELVNTYPHFPPLISHNHMFYTYRMENVNELINKIKNDSMINRMVSFKKLGV